MRNNRIGVNGFLNQPCALIPDLESIMRARMRKIVLQHNRHEAADRGSATSRQVLRVEQTCHGRRGTAESETLTGHKADSKSRSAAVSPGVLSCVLSFRSEAREALNSETARVHHAHRRGCSVAA